MHLNGSSTVFPIHCTLTYTVCTTSLYPWAQTLQLACSSNSTPFLQLSIHLTDPSSVERSM